MVDTSGQPPQPDDAAVPVGDVIVNTEANLSGVPLGTPSPSDKISGSDDTMFPSNLNGYIFGEVSNPTFVATSSLAQR